VASLDEITARFASLDDDLRLALLLDYAKRLPPIPDRLIPERDAGLNRVHECMTPVYLWMDAPDGPDGPLEMHADVADEAPTVKGVLSIIIDAFHGRPPSDVRALPTDLISKLGLSRHIRMQRAVGLNAIIGRIRNRAADLAGAPAGDTR